MAMKALSSKPFVGQDAKLRSRAAGTTAARVPVVVRAQAEEPVRRSWFGLLSSRALYLLGQPGVAVAAVQRSLCLVRTGSVL